MIIKTLGYYQITSQIGKGGRDGKSVALCFFACNILAGFNMS